MNGLISRGCTFTLQNVPPSFVLISTSLSVTVGASFILKGDAAPPAKES
jgi:hypothetical protein